MVFMRAFFRGIILFLLLIAMAVWVIAATLQMTLLNRDIVKGWIQQSGAYENVVDTLEIRQIDATGLVKSDMLRGAIDATFPPASIQGHTEVVIDAVYDWVDGKAPAITYTIPLQEHRDDFVKNLAVLIEEKVQDLPPCSGALSVNEECVPRAYTVESYAQSIAQQTANDSDLFEEPISSNDVQLNDTVATLPTLANASQLASWVLPIFIVIAGVGYVLLSRTWQQGLMNLGKRFVFSSAFLVVVGALAWVFGGSLDLATRLFGGSDETIVATVVEPIVQGAISSVGMWLTLTAGSMLLAGVILWVVGYMLYRKSASSEMSMRTSVKPVSSSSSLNDQR